MWEWVYPCPINTYSSALSRVEHRGRWYRADRVRWGRREAEKGGESRFTAVVPAVCAYSVLTGPYRAKTKRHWQLKTDKQKERGGWWCCHGWISDLNSFSSQQICPNRDTLTIRGMGTLIISVPKCMNDTCYTCVSIRHKVKQHKVTEWISAFVQQSVKKTNWHKYWLLCRMNGLASRLNHSRDCGLHC